MCVQPIWETLRSYVRTAHMGNAKELGEYSSYEEHYGTMCVQPIWGMLGSYARTAHAWNVIELYVCDYAYSPYGERNEAMHVQPTRWTLRSYRYAYSPSVVTLWSVWAWLAVPIHPARSYLLHLHNGQLSLARIQRLHNKKEFGVYLPTKCNRAAILKNLIVLARCDLIIRITANMTQGF